jgi:ribonucleotide monophosphatase NagD (HAD superfamily)
LYIESEALEDFADLNQQEPLNAVVVGLAPSMFNFQKMNQAFKLLLHEDCKLIAIHKSRYYKREDGLALGPGPFVQAFEFATGKVVSLLEFYYIYPELPDV